MNSLENILVSKSPSELEPSCPGFLSQVLIHSIAPLVLPIKVIIEPLSPAWHQGYNPIFKVLSVFGQFIYLFFCNQGTSNSENKWDRVDSHG